MATADDPLAALRRDLHRHPEPAWLEFLTTSRIVDECERIGVDELYVGRNALDSDARMRVPDDAKIESWFERARAAGAREDVLEATAGGHTGAVAVLRRGEGPVVALRVDIDALPRVEAETDDHPPAREGFRSETGAMHACGHDAHAAIGIGVLERIAASDFSGTLKVLFQPAEEVIGGGRPMAEAGHVDDVDALVAIHVGLDHPTGEIVAGIGGFLAVSHVEARFTGAGAHAGAEPNEGNNAVQAAAAAIQNLYGIPRHEEGATRVNVGCLSAPTATNVIAETATLDFEVRGETTDLMEYMHESAERVLAGAATMHDCEVETELVGRAPSGVSDDALVDVVAEVARETPSVESVVERDTIGGSEDATYLMRRVQEHGGLATYVCVGTDHPGGHHTATFDVDERSLAVGVDTIAAAVQRIAATIEAGAGSTDPGGDGDDSDE